MEANSCKKQKHKDQKDNHVDKLRNGANQCLNKDLHALYSVDTF